MSNKEKKSPELRFKGFSDDWEQRKLGSLYNIYSGNTPRRSDSSFYNDPSMPWIKTTDLNNSMIIKNEEKISDKAAKKLKILKPGTVLIAMYGGFNQIGRTGLLTYPATVNQALSAIEPIEEVNPYFLITELNFRVKEWRRLAASSRKDPNITKKDVRDFVLYYPSTYEQNKIGGLFKELDRIINLHQQKIRVFDNLRNHYVQKMFPKENLNYPELHFKNYQRKWSKSNFGSLLKEFVNKSQKENEYNILSSTNSGMEKRSGRVSGKSNKGYKIIEKGDIVLSPQNLWLGNININNLEKGLVSPSYKTFKVNEVDSKFLKPQLRKQRMLDKYKKASTQGASVVRRNLDMEQFYQIVIKVPEIEEKSEIGSFFDQLESYLAHHQLKLDKLQQLKELYLRKMFL